VGRRAAGADRGAGRRPRVGRRPLLKIHVLVVGRLKEDYLQAAEAEYLKRLRPYAQLELRELKDEAALLAAVPRDATLIALDERGEAMTSEALARDVFGRAELHGGGRPLAFAIGGADGHSDAVRARADRLLAFGKMTIAHRLVRVILLEQIYRAYRILRGEPYHR
jgi:23S rRNA (pseudouridine1915-N3)-methyltransferase